MVDFKWIEEHRHDDVNELALRAAHYPDVDMRNAIVQIRGWQLAEKKLPLWSQTEGIRFPDHLPLEQCSSQLTAEYKVSVIEGQMSEGKCLQSMTDLTGGFGVDAVMMGRRFQHLTYVEQREDLCELARHNFPLLGLKDFEVVHADCVEMLEQLPHQDLLLIDPARRDANGRKTVAISDCMPDVCALNQLLLEKADMVMIKLSPMLDIASAERQLEGVSEVHVVSVNGECKEILILLQKTHLPITVDNRQISLPLTDYGLQLTTHRLLRQAQGRQAQGKTDNSLCNDGLNPLITCVNITRDGILQYSFTRKEEQEAICRYTNEVGAYLYEPNASLMKACPFKSLAQRYQLDKLHSNSHLYTSNQRIADFPGRCFKVDEVLSLNKHTAKQISQLGRVNVSVRNFPATVADIRKRFKLTEGGTAYLFATTLVDERKVLIVAYK